MMCENPMWEKLINGKYQKWINVCMEIHFIFEIRENMLDVIISYKHEWDKPLRLIYLDGDLLNDHIKKE